MTAPERTGENATGVTNAMTVDVEDYFQVSAFAGRISRDDWATLPCRVERNTARVLDIFAERGVKATFFTLGWVAQRYPALIRRIADEGHEVASHGMAHFRVGDQTPEQFRDDIVQTRTILQDISGQPVIGYRAASFSIDRSTLWAHEVLGEAGYRYSSSIYPVRHDHYGIPDAPRFGYLPEAAGGLTELPLTTVRLRGRNLPCAGGGYFRLLPYRYFRWAIGRVNREEGQSTIFYFHPWEVDPDQPRQAGLSAKTRFRHYVNLDRMAPRLRTMLRDFAWDRMDRVFDVA
ncbi:MAG: XrtA system polysaccharide deacetylase [Rhodospirillaceae bacterium]